METENFDYIPAHVEGWIWIMNDEHAVRHVDFGDVERILVRRIYGMDKKYPEVFAGIKYACVMEVGGFLSSQAHSTDSGVLKSGDIVYVPEFNKDVRGFVPGFWYSNKLYKINEDGITSTLLLEGVSISELFYGGMTGEVNTFIERLRTDFMSLGADLEAKIDATNLKLDSEVALTQGLRGAVPDIKNAPTDACIIRIYVGDQTKKREVAAKEVTRLLNEGYRPYQTFGVSEDLARVLFVKYPEPNDANAD